MSKSTGIDESSDKRMKAHAGWWPTWLKEDLHFLVTNRIPRIAVTRLMRPISRIRGRAWMAVVLPVWNFFTPLDLRDARTGRFCSIHEVFTRSLRPGARPFDTDPLVLSSPCDAIVGACGRVTGDTLLQAKGSPYRLSELLGSAAQAAAHDGACYVTLRLTAGMYHRFHAPVHARLSEVVYTSGDTWNVNPITLARVERLFCRNERAALHLQTGCDEQPVTLVAVAAVLVASIRLHALDVVLSLRHRGPNEWRCDVPVSKGEELGWFEHGSTIIVLAPPTYRLADEVVEGLHIRAGQRLMVRQSCSGQIE